MTRASWPMRDIPVVLWLGAVVLVALTQPFLPTAKWLMIHLLLLGAVSHAILVWSKHFADALLHTPASATDRRRQSSRLALLNAGVALVLAGVLTAIWQLTFAGAAGVVAAVVWHGAALTVQARGSLSSRFAPTVRYYLAAACALPVGATLGTILARGPGDPMHARLVVAHAAVNLLGWIGLTVAGTLVTLWPTMLRTRIADGAETAARRALPVLVGAVVVTVAGSLLGSRWAAAAGLLAYLAGLALLARPFLRAARNRPPATYATWSVLSGLTWLAVCLLTVAAVVLTAPGWSEVGERFGRLTPALAAGFAAQVLLGALSYLVPVVLGGGPGAVRAANARLDLGGALRVTVVNLGLVVCMLPVPGVVRVICSALVLLGLAAFLPLLFLAIRASRRAKRNPPPPLTREQRAAAAVHEPRRQMGLFATGVAVIVLAVAGGVAVDPSALATAGAGAASDAATPTGRTVRVDVTAKDMRFSPSTIEVDAGDRLVIDLTNTDDEDVHDLTLETGQHTERLAPGESATLEIGVVGRDIDGWCSVVGHRAMGMVLDIEMTDATQPDGPAGPDGPSAAEDLDFMAESDAGFRAHDARLAPASHTRVHKHTFTVEEVEREVAPGVTQRLWTFDGTAPGPFLHGRVGDVFEITLVNDGSMGHGIDFHAGALAPDRPMRTLPPGGSLTYRFTAERSGIWMYHCSSMPMSAHIANGMFGAVVIDPPGLPEVDRSYVLVQSELYLGPQGGSVDVAKVQAERPDAVVFNGYVDQYDHRPLRARAGERVRVWVLDAGPDRSTAFHVVGGQFDTVFAEGAYRLRPGSSARGGSQSLGLEASQGGFVELEFPEAGNYPFVSHLMVDAERGAHGVFAVG